MIFCKVFQFEVQFRDLHNFCREGVNNIGIFFQGVEKRLQWESTFSDAKQTLGEGMDATSLNGDFLTSCRWRLSADIGYISTNTVHHSISQILIL